MSSTRTRLLLIAAAAIVAVGGGVTVAAGGTGGDDGDAPVTGPAADRARAAALVAVPGAAAVSVERDTEDGATWEVEVRRADGSAADVRLDADYHLVVVEGDSEGDDAGD